MPTIMRPPPASASTVIACMPSIAGGRPASCTTAVPSLMRSVVAAIAASGVIASAPYASAVHTEWKPSRSASCTSS